MSTVAEVAMQKAIVAHALDMFLEMANNHPDTPRNDWSVYGFKAVPSGSKYRIVMTVARDGITKDSSVHAFVDATTGDLFKAASYKVAAPGARYNLLADRELLSRVFTWAGGYLYTDQVKAIRKAEADAKAEFDHGFNNA